MEDKVAKRLPSVFFRQTDGKCAKLLSLAAQTHEAAKLDLQGISDSLDLNLAAGSTLDLYGVLLKLPRGRTDDTQYQFLLKSVMARTFFGNTHMDVIRSLEEIFLLKPGEVALADAEDSASVRVIRLPFGALQHAGFTGEETELILGELLSVGVGLEMDNFEGSFTFAATDAEYDETQGFSDAELNENQTMGGFFGYLVGVDVSKPLPL